MPGKPCQPKNAAGHSGKKLQAAIEYLMTYGWAILAVAVALVVLFLTGALNPMTYESKAQPGSCFVTRPYGPNTTAYIYLASGCKNQIPEFVAEFNGQGSYITFAQPNTPTTSNASSAFAWVYITSEPPSSPCPCFYNILGIGEFTNYGMRELAIGGMSSTSASLYFGGDSDDYPSTLSVPLSSWHFVGYTYSSNTDGVTVYLDGQPQTGALSGGVPLNTINTNCAIIGAGISASCQKTSFLAGSIANVQLYNTSLTPNEVKSLYLEGIGGAPTDLQHLVGWWQLNGNPNDSSGDGLNGTANSVTYSSMWYTGYTAP